MAANFEDAVLYLEKSTAVFEELLDKGRSWMVEEASAALADSYYSLADSYIQLGRHAESTDRYNQAMAILEKFQLPAAASPAPTTDAVDESIAAFEKALEEYQSLMNDPTNEEEYSIDDQGNPVYEKDDGYEGDLYTTLGSLYLSNGDYVTAESNLLQAIRLYDMSGEDAERSTADAKFNLAAIYYQNNRYRESAEIRSEALNIYLETVGEGINPLLDGTPTLDLSEFQSRHKKETDSTIPTKGDLETVISVEDYHEAMDNETARDEL
jgi:tetratricopeptide (TPR) repeat protein